MLFFATYLVQGLLWSLNDDCPDKNVIVIDETNVDAVIISLEFYTIKQILTYLSAVYSEVAMQSLCFGRPLII